jgi:hypothetical protein
VQGGGTSGTGGSGVTTTPGSEILPGSQVFPGGTMTVKLAGFMIGSNVQVFLLSDEIHLGDDTADATGAVIVTFTVPASFTGTHVVEGRGVDPNGNPYTARVVFTLGTPPGPTFVPGFTG